MPFHLDRLPARGADGGAPPAFFNVPLFMSPGPDLEQILQLGTMLRADPLSARALFGYWSPPRPQPQATDGIAVVKVRGSLYRGMFWDDYAELRSQISEALDSSAVQAVLLDIDSPGGSVAGCFELSSWIHAQRDRKPIWAIANDQATSAAYAIASAAERVYMPPSGIVGSIGAICIHVDMSKAHEMEGYKVTEVASGTRKAELSSHKPLSASGRETLQRVVDACGEQFFAAVSLYRPDLGVDTIRDMQAAVFVAAEAQSAGLVDGVAQRDEVLARLRAELNPGPSSALGRPPTAAAAPLSTGEIAMSQANPNPEAPVVVPPVVATVPAPTVTVDPQVAFQQRAREITNTCALAGHPEMAGEFIATGATLQAVQDRLLALRAANDADPINGHVDPTRAQQHVQPVIDVGRVYRRWNSPKELASPVERRSN